MKLTKEEERALIARRLQKKPVRQCQTLHECCLCTRSITLGEFYFDGGHGSRAHINCADKAVKGMLPEKCEEPPW